MSREIPVKIAKVYDDAIVPYYATDAAAGFDISAYLPPTKQERRLNDAHLEVIYDKYPVTLWPGQRMLIGTGLRFAVPKGYELQLRPRSGLANKYGISLVNTPATIDADYRGEVKVLLINHGDRPFSINHGDRIAQGIIAESPQASFELVTELDETERGAGGFGSTGVKISREALL